MLSLQNRQRGMSYDPAIAKRQREAQRIVAESRLRDEHKAERKEALRAHGRMLDQQAREARKGSNAPKPLAGRAMGRRLDQIERCYREYTPVQIHSCNDMLALEREFNGIEQAFDTGAIEWREDILCAS